MHRRKIIQGSFWLMTIVVLAACQPDEPQVVEVTRVVTETVVETVEVEEQAIEVTPMVVETVVVETVTIMPEIEPLDEGQQTLPGDSPFSRGSEGDAVPLPTPATGPKVDGGFAPLAAGSGGDGVRAGTAVDIPLAESSRLRAGEVDDNENWAEYLAYLQSYTAENVIPLAVSERHTIQVVDALSRPMSGVPIRIEVNGELVTELRTHSDGTVLFFPGLYSSQTGSYEVTAVNGAQTVSMLLAVGGAGQNRQLMFTGEGERGTAVPLDILFLIDATGSMADEIRQLKDNMVAIAMQINTLPSQPDVRFSFVTYRDRTDDFPVNLFPFTANLEPFVAALAAIEARGGGDYPEDLHAGLAIALHGADWRQENGVSLIFLIADAPPHLDYPGQDDYTTHLRQAATQGIKIYPIASSGLDTQGEYIFRQLAQVTNGRFIFLTADTGITAADEPTFVVTNYSVADLDDLIVQIVTEELAPLNP
ncbi:MAG: VWA domain-containing protein [Anaerolineae bacterium]|nr:VWA domain-containing protein [Anaerolineae bacterium]